MLTKEKRLIIGLNVMPAARGNVAFTSSWVIGWHINEIEVTAIQRHYRNRSLSKEII